ncbi:hypothetical protein FJR08_11435 [Dolichospermum sp. UHCC 0260]|jgi:hypothetical protein|nr:hypothetical protein [Dolichospermum sp. UHCC 0260]
MANATLRYRQAQYKSCPLDMYLITPGSAVICAEPVKNLNSYISGRLETASTQTKPTLRQAQ